MYKRNDMETGLDTILLIEDDEIDTELATRIIKAKAPSMRIITVGNGVEALQYLFPASGASAHLLNIKIVLLDLHMPGIDGFEVLKRMKTDMIARLIPVVVFTSSRELKDVETCYRYGANSYIVKPIAMEQFEDVVSNIVHYWSHHNESVKEYSIQQTQQEVDS
ncbi:MAG: response regulator [Ignavibacteriales bacterium]|nr:response regulator [Ignavibacteriales bacterium]